MNKYTTIHFDINYHKPSVLLHIIKGDFNVIVKKWRKRQAVFR